MAVNKLEQVARQLSKGTKKKAETYVVNAIYHKVNNPELQIETQKGVNYFGKRYLIDMYLPQLKIAIEVDEFYHQNSDQQLKDKGREREIEIAVRQTLGNNVKFIRIPADIKSISLSEINNEIDRAVEYIKNRISEKPITWEEIDSVAVCKERGSIKSEDRFYSNLDVVNLVYGLDLKGCQRALYKDVWFPVISRHKFDKTNNRDYTTSAHGWINEFSPDKHVLYQRTEIDNKQEKLKADVEKRKNSHERRYVFVKEYNAFGDLYRRFAGVFEASGWDDEQDAERWDLVSVVLNIPIKK